MTRTVLRRRATCPDCGRTKIWLGETFAAHRRAAAQTRPRPVGAGLDVLSMHRQSTTCEGSGRTIEDRHLR